MMARVLKQFVAVVHGWFSSWEEGSKLSAVVWYIFLYQTNEFIALSVAALCTRLCTHFGYYTQMAKFVFVSSRIFFSLPFLLFFSFPYFHSLFFFSSTRTDYSLVLRVLSPPFCSCVPRVLFYTIQNAFLIGRFFFPTLRRRWLFFFSPFHSCATHTHMHHILPWMLLLLLLVILRLYLNIVPAPWFSTIWKL